MDKNIENKLDEIIKTIQVGFKNVDNRFEGVDKKIDNKIDGAMRGVKVGFDEIHEKISTLEGKVNNIEDNMATKKDIQNLKLDLIDKYADKEKVSDHEVRITNLEEKLV